MTRDYFSLLNVHKARKLLRLLISLARTARHNLEEAPYSDRELLTQTSDEIAQYVQGVLRRVQLAYSALSSEALEMLMDLGTCIFFLFRHLS